MSFVGKVLETGPTALVLYSVALSVSTVGLDVASVTTCVIAVSLESLQAEAHSAKDKQPAISHTLFFIILSSKSFH